MTHCKAWLSRCHNLLKIFNFHFISVWSLKFINRKCLKAISSVKTQEIIKLFQRKNNIIFLLSFIGYFIGITHINWIHNVWVDLINERQLSSFFIGSKNGIPWNKPITGAMKSSQKLKLLESDSITWLVLLCSSTYPLGLSIYRGSLPP